MEGRAGVAPSSPVRVGTRGSALALRQTELVVDLLREAHPNLSFEPVVVRTQGDANATAPLAGMGLGVFVKEIEQQLLSGEIDLAVHSLKDMPTQLPEGLTIGAVLEREDPRDVQVNRWGVTLGEIPANSRIGTSSPRRQAQLRRLHPGLTVVPLRGNVETRLRKSEGGECDGAILAAAGLSRLGLSQRITEFLDPREFVPPPGQGALAVETRDGDGRMLELLSPAEHSGTRSAVTAERAFLEVLGGGCQTPVAAYATCEGDRLELTAFMASPSGDEAFRCMIAGPANDPRGLAAEAFRELAEQGADGLVERG